MKNTKAKKQNLKGNYKNNNKSKKENKEGKEYRVGNWQEYNNSLKNRGKITFWISEEVVEEWKSESRTGKRGRPQKYSDKVIKTVLMAKEALGYPLRQTEGFLEKMSKETKASVPIPVPDYSTLSLRAAQLSINIKVRRTKAQGRTPHIVIDSTGAKIYGEGEWKTKKHGWSKHRRWKKLHFAVNERTGDIVAAEATDNDVSDIDIIPTLLSSITPARIGKISADGAYDTRKVYGELKKYGGVDKIAIPPQRNAKIWKHANAKGVPHPRDENLRFIRKHGRKKWKKESEYHRRSLSETCISRFKNTFGAKMTARKAKTQETQFKIRCKLLNKMTMLGIPESYPVS